MQNLRGEQGRGETLHPPAQAGGEVAGEDDLEEDAA
jgi:hypothetical protein